MSWEIARCKKNRYCDFSCTHEDKRAKVEACIYCGRRVIYRKVDGRTDNVKYLKMHIRNFAQPYGASRKVFEEIYGKARLMRYDRDIDKAKWRVSAKDHAMREKRRAEVMDFYNALGQSSR